MSKEAKIVAIVRRLDAALQSAPLDKIEVCMENLKTAQEAARLHGLEDLALATLDHETLASKDHRELLTEALGSPSKAYAYISKATIQVRKFKQYL